MRAQLAQSNLVLGSSVSINEEIKKWMSEHQGQTPPASLIMEWKAKAPNNPTVQSLFDQQKLTMEQQAQQLQTAKSLYDSGQINREEYGRRVRAIEQPQSSQSVPANAAGKPADEVPKPVDGMPKTADGAPVVVEKKQDGSRYYSTVYPAPDVSAYSKPQGDLIMKQWSDNAAVEEKRYTDQLNLWGDYTIGTNYHTLNNQFETAIGLMEKHPEIADKVFNLLRGEGGLKNQILAALNKGVGINFNGFTGSINFPVDIWQSSGLSKTEQNYADRLVNAMLNIGNAKLAIQKITPSGGQQAYFENLLTKANLSQNPETAYRILSDDRLSFNHTKELQNMVTQEKKEGKVSPTSLVPTADIFANSPLLKKIDEDTAKKYRESQDKFNEIFNKDKKPPVAANKPATSSLTSDVPEGYIRDKGGVIRRKRSGE